MISSMLSTVTSSLLRNGLLLAVAGGTVACVVAPLAASMLAPKHCECEVLASKSCSGVRLYDEIYCEEDAECTCGYVVCNHFPTLHFDADGVIKKIGVVAGCTDPL